jgi:hypothetical protein
MSKRAEGDQKLLVFFPCLKISLVIISGTESVQRQVTGWTADGLEFEFP